MAFISGKQGNKQYSGTGRNIRIQNFDFGGAGEQANLFQGNKGTGSPPPPPWRASLINCTVLIKGKSILT